MVFATHCHHRSVGLGAVVGQSGDDLRGVQRVGNRLAQTHIFKKRVAGLEQQGADRHGAAGRNLHPGHRRQLVGIQWRDIDQQVDVFRQQRSLGRRWIGNDHQFDSIELRRFVAGVAIGRGLFARRVTGETQQFDRLRRFPLTQPERPGADWCFPGAGHDRVRVHDAAATTFRQRRAREKKTAWLVECEHHGQRIWGGDINHFSAAAAIKRADATPLGFRVQVSAPGPQHFCRRQRRAVLKLHAFAQMEGVAQAVFGDLHIFRQQRPDAGIFAKGHQAFGQMQDHRIGVGVTVNTRLGAADVCVQGHGQRAVCPSVGCQYRRKAAGQKKSFVHIKNL
ncbi:hypothetical protein D3C86_1036840 [compost metagenome]